MASAEQEIKKPLRVSVADGPSQQTAHRQDRGGAGIPAAFAKSDCEHGQAPLALETCVAACL
jgi:hypothetical protein